MHEQIVQMWLGIEVFQLHKEESQLFLSRWFALDTLWELRWPLCVALGRPPRTPHLMFGWQTLEALTSAIKLT